MGKAFSEFLGGLKEQLLPRIEIDRILRLKITREKLSQHMELADQPTEVKIIASKGKLNFVHPIRDSMRYNIRLINLDNGGGANLVALGTYSVKSPDSISAKMAAIMEISGEKQPELETGYFERLEGALNRSKHKNFRINYEREMERIAQELETISKGEEGAIPALLREIQNRIYYEKEVLNFIASLEAAHVQNSPAPLQADYSKLMGSIWKPALKVEESFSKIKSAFLAQRKNLYLDAEAWSQLDVSDWPAAPLSIQAFLSWAQKNRKKVRLEEWVDNYISLIERMRFKYLSTQSKGPSLESMFANPNKTDYLGAFIGGLEKIGEQIPLAYAEQIQLLISMAAKYEELCDEATQALASVYAPERKLAFLVRFSGHHSAVLKQVQKVLGQLSSKQAFADGTTLAQKSADSRRMLALYLSHLGWSDYKSEKKLFESLSNSVKEFLKSLPPAGGKASPPLSPQEREALESFDAKAQKYLKSTKARQDMAHSFFSRIEGEHKSFKEKRSLAQAALDIARKELEARAPIHKHCVDTALDFQQSHSDFKFGFWRAPDAMQIFGTEVLGLSALSLLSNEIYHRNDPKNFPRTGLWGAMDTETLASARDELHSRMDYLHGADAQILRHISAASGPESVFFSLNPKCDEGLWHLEQDVRDLISKSSLQRFTNKDVKAKKIELKYAGGQGGKKLSVDFKDRYNKFSIEHSADEVLYASRLHSLPEQQKLPKACAYGIASPPPEASRCDYIKRFSKIADYMVINRVHENRINGIYKQAFFGEKIADFSYTSLTYLIAALYDARNEHKGMLIRYNSQIYEIPAFGLLPKYASPLGNRDKTYLPPLEGSFSEFASLSPSQGFLCPAGKLEKSKQTAMALKENFLEHKRMWRMLQEQAPLTSKYVRKLKERKTRPLF